MNKPAKPKSSIYMLLILLEALDKMMNLPDINSVADNGKDTIVVNSANGTQVIITVEKQPFIR